MRMCVSDELPIDYRISSSAKYAALGGKALYQAHAYTPCSIRAICVSTRSVFP